VGSPEERGRLALCVAVLRTMEAGLGLLGVPWVRRM
jgi:arginyl-tRNA synthetase